MSNVAAIDIGSNSVRLLVNDAQGAEVVREMRITRLGQGVDETGRLDEAAMARTLSVLADYTTLARERAVARLRITATSAARDADNRATFFGRVRALFGQEPELLSGEAEAELSFRGALDGRAPEGGPFVVVDLGGGSTEIAVGRALPEQSVSLALGCVRVTERFLKSDPPSPSELAAAAAYTREQLARAEHLPARTARTWIGVAGTVTSLAACDASLTRYTPEVTHGYTLRQDRVERWHHELARLPRAERATKLIDPQRAGVIVGGSLVLLEVLRYFERAELVVSERDILDGLAASLLA